MKSKEEVREQIQEDIRTYLPHADDHVIDGLCQIIVDNFEKLKDDEIFWLTKYKRKSFTKYERLFC